jgi:hypothetical protein
MTQPRTHRRGSDETPLSFAIERGTPRAGRPIAVELTFTPPEPATVDRPRLPLNVGLSIDRSGSMAGEKLDAARRAAIGVVENLADREQLAVTAFDHDVVEVSPSVRLDATRRATIRERISRLEPGGTTALFDGFLRTAGLVATGASSGRSDNWTIILSDGMGNQGITDPPTMRRQAAAIAEDGIRTITVGIGADYEAAQLTALADGGGGEFHHATNPGEIVEIVLGELRAMRMIAARDLELRLTVRGARRWPPWRRRSATGRAGTGALRSRAHWTLGSRRGAHLARSRPRTTDDLGQGNVAGCGEGAS